MDVPRIVLGLVGGLALFLYGVGRLAAGLRAAAGGRMRALLTRATANRVAAALTGAAATAVLDSSSVTIIMTVALVDAGLLTSAAALGVILGANVGTTLSSQLVALDVQRYAPAVLAAGLVVGALGARADARAAAPAEEAPPEDAPAGPPAGRWTHVGTAVFGLGLVFFGLGQMGAAVEPLRESPRFAGWMTGLERPLVGAGVGALVTVVLQSSSATLGVAITLAQQGLMTTAGGVAVMLGAEVGTCADTLVAAAGRSRAALRAGVFHLGFNMVTAAAGLALVGPLTALAAALGGGPARQVANAHVAFNLVGALAALALLGPAARLLDRLLPDRAPARRALPGRPGAAATA